MGEIRRYRCNCGYESELYIGVGLQGCNAEAAAKFFPKEMEKVLEERDLGKISGFILENVVASCKQCKKLYTVPELVCSKTDGTREKFVKSVCQDCGKDVIIYSEDEVKCPICDLEVSYSEIGCWD